MMLPIAKDKEVARNTKIKNMSVDFNTLTYSERKYQYL